MCLVSQLDPQQPGVAHSQPSVSGAVAALQSDAPLLHVYEQLPPLHASAEAFVAVQAMPHAPQFEVVVVCVSHPSTSGAVAALQSPKPVSQVYEQVVPLQLEAEALSPLHTVVHEPQVETEESEVSQPLRSGGVVVQSAKPVSQPAYWHVVPLHDAPTL